MPVESRYIDARGYLHATVREPVSISEIEEGLRRVVTSAQHPANVPTLWDLREWDFGSVNRSRLMQIIDVRSRHPDRGNARLALLVKTEVQFGLSRMYELLSDSHDLPQLIQVFYSEEEALNWLLHQEPDRAGDFRNLDDGASPSRA